MLVLLLYLILSYVVVVIVVTFTFTVANFLVVSLRAKKIHYYNAGANNDVDNKVVDEDDIATAMQTNFFIT